MARTEKQRLKRKMKQKAISMGRISDPSGDRAKRSSFMQKADVCTGERTEAPAIPPGIFGHVQVGLAALLQLRSIALDPAIDGGVVDPEASLGHHLFQVPIELRL